MPEIRATDRARLTALVPARDEAGSIAATIASLRAQSRPPDDILVIDDGSSDGTGEIARGLGATVLRTAGGSKSAALNFGLSQVTTDMVLTVDADTYLEPDAVERLLVAIAEPDVAAASAFVLPLHMRTIWERARYVEYLLTCWLHKPIQEDLGALIVISGCCAVYRTAPLRRCGGWPVGTIAEDMSLTWQLQAAGHRVRHVTDAVCRVIDPSDRQISIRQTRRWAHGLLQNLRAHWPDLMTRPYLRTILVISVVSRLLDCALWFAVWPLLAITVDPWFLLGTFMTVPLDAVTLVPIGVARGELGRVLTNLPCRLPVQMVRSLVFAQAVWSELVARRSLTVFEKGH